jgi:hypothetical protein
MLRRVPPKNVEVPRACAWGSTCGVGNDTEVDESGLFRSAPPSLLPVMRLLHEGLQLLISGP